MIIFVTGIDTGVGKTEATGWLAGCSLSLGIKATTMKLVQTGGSGPSEDIRRHRAIMGAAWDVWDEQGLTCPQRFAFPASPHLAAAREGRQVDLEAIDQALTGMARRFPLIFLEGVGGVEVPLRDTTTVLDFVAAQGYPCLVVTSPRLGSINHTLLTVRALAGRGLTTLGLLYNTHHAEHPEIAADTREVFRRYLSGTPLFELPSLAGEALPPPGPDLQALLLSLAG